MQTKKESYCKVCLHVERGSGYLCALVMCFKTTWWKILIRTYCHCNRESHKTKPEKEKRNTACSSSRGWNIHCSLLMNPNFILFQKNLNFNISDLLHSKFCQLLSWADDGFCLQCLVGCAWRTVGTDVRMPNLIPLTGALLSPHYIWSYASVMWLKN